MLFLSAIKFSASTPSSSTDITTFLNSDPGSLPKVPITSSEVKTQRNSLAITATKKATTSLESFFQKAAEKHKIKEASVSSLATTAQAPISNSPSKPSLSFQSSHTVGAEPFFKQKSLLLKEKQVINTSKYFPTQNALSSSKELPSSFPIEYPYHAPVCKKVLKLGSTKGTPAETYLTQDSPSRLPSHSALEVAQKEITTPSLLAAEDQVLCEKCSSLVPVWDMPEHRDYHFALELQKSFLQPHSSNPQIVPASSPQSKRNLKSSQASSSKRPKPEGMQTLDTFFKPLTH